MIRIRDAVLTIAGFGLLGAAYAIGVHPWVQHKLQEKELAQLLGALRAVEHDLTILASNAELATNITGGRAPAGLSPSSLEKWETSGFIWEPLSPSQGFIIIPADTVEAVWKLDQALDDGGLDSGKLLLHPNGARLRVSSM